MQILTGTITDIMEEESPFDKKIVILGLPEKQTAFVEFRGKIMTKLLEEINKTDTVQIAVSFNGSISKKSGLHFNNLVAKTIKKL